ncbi:hypothetical protein KW791_02670 [Candidatus Parcubacteria bacterium]|nr:hypothetical protein [Candidatus Parcubacteria bacterium]
MPELLQEEFVKVLTEYVAFRGGVKAVADSLLQAVPTIERWLDWKTCPHPTLTRPLIESMKKEMKPKDR